jgi:tRNA pseudouridine55 synthase
MKDVLLLNKQVGETPLACIERFRAAHSEYVGMKMTYAGRLDPIAEGLLIVLVGDAVHHKDEYSNLPKVYECVALLGVSTDTYDILGLPTVSERYTHESNNGAINHLMSENELESVLSEFVGSFQQAYPPYSSKTVDGRQLHQIARSGEIDTVEIPTRTASVEWVRDVKVVSITPDELLRHITDTVSRVQGDFRQQQIMDAWQSLSGSLVQLVSFTIAVSSGTYIRGIVNSLGEKLGIGACIMSLKRTSVGEFLLSDVKNFID